MKPEAKTIENRRICAHQGMRHEDPLISEEDTPCLICSGDVISIDGELVCPFTMSTDNRKFAVFRSTVNMDYVTEVEKTFAKVQENKIKGLSMQQVAV